VTTEDKMVAGIIISKDMSLSKFQEMMDRKPGVLQSMGLQRAGYD